MSKTAHRIFIILMTAVVVAVLALLIYEGYSYYHTPLEERFYHPDYKILKPSGIWGHGLGIIGSLFMIIGVSTYMIRKRWRRISRWGLLKHWLEFHIFLNTLGPILVLFHTSFKFGGLVAISFWSMVAVFVSGVIGRFIYIQIPRTIEGRQLSLGELSGQRKNVGDILQKSYDLDDESYHAIIDSTRSSDDLNSGNILARTFKKYFNDRRVLRKVRSSFKKNKLSREERKKILKLIRNEILLNRRIERLHTMQELFKYWHVAHLPFALVMLIIMVIHVVVTIIFGYRWIF